MSAFDDLRDRIAAGPRPRRRPGSDATAYAWGLRGTALGEMRARSALLFTLAAAVAFVVIQPPVGDLWAAKARASAATHGVNLDYWFAWFSGTIPGQYSVIAPYLARVMDVGWLGAGSTIVITWLCHRLLRGSAHPAIGTWFAAIGFSFNLWSGRVPFAVGTALMLVALLFIRADRPIAGGLAAAATALVSPVSGAFLILALPGVILHDGRRRLSAVVASLCAGGCLVGVAAYFGVPGPEGFIWWQVVFTAIPLAALLVCRPPAYVRTVVLIALVLCPVIAFVPNGMGSNFERFAWICLPVAAAATARSRTWVTGLCASLGIAAGAIGSTYDLIIAAQPMSRISYYRGLIAELDTLPRLDNYRLEVVPDGTHVAAYALLDHAQLARGYETQTDNARNRVLSESGLDAATFKVWLDANAVGYVAVDHTSILTTAEDRLIRSGPLPYLHQIWSDGNWKLFRVSSPTPIVAPPARVVEADQASLTVRTPQAGTLELRVRWSHFLHITGPGGEGSIIPDGRGWTTLIAPAPGRYRLSG